MLDSETVKELTADVVSAYVSNNSVPISQLTEVIESVHAALASLVSGAPADLPVEVLKASVNPKKSVFPDYIICLDDGKRFSSLKRHVAKLGMTPVEYRAKWNLPGDYPMVAPNYSERRSQLAKSFGLGRKPMAAAGKTEKAK